ncbi:MAG: S24/S26 family peptidase [Bilophila sp.]
MFLKIDQVYTPVEGPPEGFHEEPAHYADPTAIRALVKVYSTQCAYEEGKPAPELQTSKSLSPQSYVNAQTLVFLIESDSFSPLIRRGAYVGVDTTRTHPISGEIYAVFMPHEGVALKRLFLDGDQETLQLRTGQPSHPGVALLPQDCQERILGRLSWVLQHI